MLTQATSSHLRMVALVLLPPLVAFGIAAQLAYSKILTNSQQSTAFINAPDNWVAFHSDVVVTYPDGKGTIGRYYRSSDGSSRLESGPALNDIRGIHIVNVPDRTEYHWDHSTQQWLWRALQGMRVPPRIRQGLSGWHLYPYRLALRAGESGEVNAITGGFEAYFEVQESGVLTYMVPELNFFKVIAQRPDGRYQKFTNIQVHEPDPALFHPPAGAVIVPNPRPVSVLPPGTAE